MNKESVLVLDVMSIMAFISGVVTATTILAVLGGLASVAAMVNHGIDIFRKLKKK